MPTDIEIHCKVSILDILKLRNKLKKIKDKRILIMHADYTLVIRETQEIIMAIELDDKLHNTEEAKLRDERKDQQFKDAKIHLKRIPEEIIHYQDIITEIATFCKNKIITTNET